MGQNSFHLGQQNNELNLTFVGIVCASCQETSADDIEMLMLKDLVIGEASVFRGKKGRGFICVGENSIELCEDDLLLVPTHQITAAVPNSSTWNFTQYRFVASKELEFLEEKTKYSLPVKKEEELLIKELFYQSYANASYCKHLIGALFLTQLYRWGMELETTTKSQNMYRQKIQFAIEYINQHVDEPLSITELSTKFNISERHFRYMFHQITGKSPKTYQGELRLNKIAHLLNTTDLTIQEISDSMGYYSQYQLSRDFKKMFGMSPSDYRKGNFI